MPEFTIQAENLKEPVRVDKLLSDHFPSISRSAWKRLFQEGRITVNGFVAKPSTRVHNGDVVTGEMPGLQSTAIEPEPLPLNIVYEDADIVVIDKPAGLITHPSPNRLHGTLVNALLHHCNELSTTGGRMKPGIVHRLDKLTSGVMVAAKTDQAHEALARQFKEHTISRKYLALVHGEPRQLSGTLESPISRNPKHRLKMTGQAEQGRKALTRYRLLSASEGLSLVELELHTGRTHQIRVHLSEMNHPVVGDALYGKGRTLPARLDPQTRSALRQLKRQALHAYHLGFLHPCTSEPMAFESPLPQDMKAAVKALGLEKNLHLPDTPARIK
ncbi:MAG: RluA family pseudouridine synthase [bacterium]